VCERDIIASIYVIFDEGFVCLVKLRSVVLFNAGGGDMNARGMDGSKTKVLKWHLCSLTSSYQWSNSWSGWNKTRNFL
jgi:hypothetical protein